MEISYTCFSRLDTISPEYASMVLMHRQIKIEKSDFFNLLGISGSG